MVGPVSTEQQADFASPANGRLGVTKKLNSDDLKAPDNRIPSEAAARTVYNRLRKGHLKRCIGFERIAGMLAGNPPYNARRMQAAGLSDMTNVNFKDGKAMIQQNELAYWSLFNEVENIAEFKLDFANDQGKNEEWGKVLSEEFDRVIRLWPDFLKGTSFHQSDLLKFGLNAWFWADEDDWRPIPIDIRDLLIPDETENREEALSLIGIERTFNVSDLWEIYEHALKTPGGVWDANALGNVLWQLANISDDQKKTVNGIVDLQKYITNNDIHYESLYTDAIHLVSLLQKEYDGKISHIMIHRSLSCEEPIYFADRQYERFSEAIMYFTLQPGEKYIHGNKGVGHDIYSAVEAITQLDCSALDQGKRAGSLLVKASATRGRDERGIRFVHGGVIDVGEADIQQNTMGANLPATIQTSQYFTGKILRNNNLMGMDPGYPDKNVSKANMQRQATREGRVQKNQIAFYYSQCDFWFREIVRKMLHATPTCKGYEYAKMFKDRCVARNVPAQLFDVLKNDLKPDGLPLHMELFATRSSGSGSQVADQTEMQATMQILPLLGERGRINVIQDYIAAFRGFRYVSRYFPPEDQSREPTSEDTIASIENNQLSQGMQVVVSPDNNHAVHAPAHARMLADWMKMYQEQGQGNTDLLFKVNDAFAAGGPHFTKHLLLLSQDPTRKALTEQLRAQWAVLANFGDMIKNNAMNAMQAQQKQQQGQQQKMDQVQADMQVGMAKVDAKSQIDQAKLESDIERDRKRDQNKFLLAATAMGDKHRIEIIKTTQELALNARKEMGDEQTTTVSEES